MKKLLFTTALAGVVLGSVAAQAETKVTGNLSLSYASTKDDKASPLNWSGFGKESQINVSNSGDLNNGWKYKAGFSLEMDAGDTGASAASVSAASIQGQQSENVYIDFINGPVTISLGMDHFQNTHTYTTHLVGFGEIAPDGLSQNAAGKYMSSQSSAYGNFGVGIAYATPFGSIGAYHVPSADAAIGFRDVFNGASSTVAGVSKSANEINFIGNLGVKGLKVVAGRVTQESSTTGYNVDGQRIAAQYTMGQFTVGVDTNKRDTGTAATEYKGKSYGVAYAINDNLSAGYTYAKTELTGNTNEEKVQIYALGYNLGAVTVQAQLKSADNVNNVNGNNGKQYGILVGTKF
jgi:hypothetical protein